MQNQPKPHALITAKDRLDRVLVEHARFDEAVQRIMSAILFPTDTKIIFVIGPTGVGKSRLLQKICSRIHNAITSGTITGASDIPCVSLEVPCANNHRFSWKEFFSVYLDELKSPLRPTDKSLAALPAADIHRGLEHVVLNALRYRRPLATLLDEANHFTSVASGKVLLEQMTRLKSFTNRANVLHICFGTYELAHMTNLSGQLARRCEVIHFGRYRKEDNDDFKAFEKVVRNFQASIPVAHHFDLSANTLYLHERSIGCVGTLKTWLLRAVSHAHQKGRTAITRADLEATAHPIGQLQKMLEEAIIGESTLCETHQQDLDLFRAELGHIVAPEKSSSATHDLLGYPIAPARVDSPKARVQPFQQSPARRATGAGRNDELTRRAS